MSTQDLLAAKSPLESRQLGFQFLCCLIKGQVSEMCKIQCFIVYGMIFDARSKYDIHHNHPGILRAFLAKIWSSRDFCRL